MGYGESYLIWWWKWAEERSFEEKVAYFREFAPIPVAWVDWVGMQILNDEDDEGDEDLSFEGYSRKYGEAIAHLGLYDVEAWQAYMTSDEANDTSE